ncbi:MAG: hypothetical protein AAFO58_13355, partial [Pseudomonadota bacterium]
PQAPLTFNQLQTPLTFNKLQTPLTSNQLLKELLSLTNQSKQLLNTDHQPPQLLQESKQLHPPISKRNPQSSKMPLSKKMWMLTTRINHTKDKVKPTCSHLLNQSQSKTALLKTAESLEELLL